jgi:AcrR family transcriptional regulator
MVETVRAESSRTSASRRTPLSRDRVLGVGVALADEEGLDALSMRHLAQRLGVVPMALYKHVANKEELLDGMVDVVLSEIEPPLEDVDWRTAVRHRVLSARRALLRHPWARPVIETRTGASAVVLDHINSLVAMFRAGGFSAVLTHHVMHALGSRMWGFTQEVFPGAPPPEDPQLRATMFHQLATRWPHVAAIAAASSHDDGSVVGQGCDDQFEFEFTLDLMLDGFERLRHQGWTPSG